MPSPGWEACCLTPPIEATTSSSPARPGGDWLDPVATTAARPRSSRQRLRVVVAAAALFTGGFALWRATSADDTGRVAPLSFALVGSP